MQNNFVTDGDIERFYFLRHMPTRQRVLKASDIVLPPNSSEGLALVVAKAMLSDFHLMRMPSRGACDQIEDSMNGCIAPFDNVEALTERIERPFDGAFRNRIVAAACAKASAQFTTDITAQNTNRAYDTVAQGH